MELKSHESKSTISLGSTIVFCTCSASGAEEVLLTIFSILAGFGAIGASIILN